LGPTFCAAGGAAVGVLTTCESTYFVGGSGYEQTLTTWPNKTKIQMLQTILKTYRDTGARDSANAAVGAIWRLAEALLVIEALLAVMARDSVHLARQFTILSTARVHRKYAGFKWVPCLWRRAQHDNIGKRKRE